MSDELGRLGLSKDDLAFRDEVRGGWPSTSWASSPNFGGRGAAASDEGFEVRARREKELARGGWLGLGFPRRYGGREASVSAQIVFAYECADVGAPYRLSIQGTEMIGPTIVAVGTGEQKQRFLPEILAADVIWCQGGSANPTPAPTWPTWRTRARLGRLTIGSSTARRSGRRSATTPIGCYVLCRTQPGPWPEATAASRCCLVCPCTNPVSRSGRSAILRARPSSARCTSTRARTDADLVVGDVDDGWGVALTVLGFERATATLPHQMQFEREVDDLIARAVAPDVRVNVLLDRLVEAWIGVRILAFGILLTLYDPHARRVLPGPSRRLQSCTGRSGTSGSAS